MVLWGKLCGGILGWLLTGVWWGVLAGLVLGHAPDWYLGRLRQRPSVMPRMRVDSEVFTGMFAIMGYLACVDGRISGAERALVESVMDAMELKPEQREQALAAFEAGQAPDFHRDHQIWRLQKRLRRHPRRMQRFILTQLEMVWADGPPTTDQQQALELVGRRVGYSHARLVRLQESMHAGGVRPKAPTRDDIGEAYKLLGVTRDDDEPTIRKAYRRMLSRNHPDRLASQGESSEVVEEATEFTRRIRNAYEMICSARGFRV